MLTTVSANVAETAANSGSVAVTWIEIEPTSLFSGVPENVRVAGLNLNQAGSGLPLANRAEYSSTLPAFGSMNALAANWKEIGASSRGF